MNDECPIWGTPCKKTMHGHAWQVDSPRAGGKYIVTGIALDEITVLDKISKVKLSRWIYEQNQRGKIPEIDSNTLEVVKMRPMPSVPKRTEYCLQFLASKTEALGGAVDMVSCSDEMQAAALLKNDDEAVYLIKEFINEDWIKIKPGAESNSGLVVIRLKGYLQLEELKKTNVASA